MSSAERYYAVVSDATGHVEWFGPARNARAACKAYLGEPNVAGGFMLERVAVPRRKAARQGRGGSTTFLRVHRLTPAACIALQRLHAYDEAEAIAALVALTPHAACFEAVMVRAWLRRFRRRLSDTKQTPYPNLSQRERAWEALLVAATDDPQAHMTRLGGIWAKGCDLDDRELLRLAKRLKRLAKGSS